MALLRGRLFQKHLRGKTAPVFRTLQCGGRLAALVFQALARFARENEGRDLNHDQFACSARFLPYFKSGYSNYTREFTSSHTLRGARTVNVIEVGPPGL